MQASKDDTVRASKPHDLNNPHERNCPGSLNNSVPLFLVLSGSSDLSTCEED